jgi:hypothetical protein
VIVWFLPWAVIAGVIGVAVWIGVDALSGGGDKTVVVAGPSASPSKSQKETTTTTTEVKPSKSPTATATPKESPTPDDDRKLITEGISIQVLNASGVAGAENAMSDRLEKLGFDVVAVQQASTAYPRTTVFWSFAESKPAAKALAARFGWVAQAKPENLSASVDVHVVVGQDEG